MTQPGYTHWEKPYFTHWKKEGMPGFDQELNQNKEITIDAAARTLCGPDKDNDILFCHLRLKLHDAYGRDGEIAGRSYWFNLSRSENGKEYKKSCSGIYLDKEDFEKWAKDNAEPIEKDRVRSRKKPANPTETEALLTVDRRFTEHELYSKELHIAIKAWNAICLNNGLSSKKSPKAQIKAWLLENQQGLSNEAIERIATIVNPNKSGGAPSVS